MKLKRFFLLFILLLPLIACKTVMQEALQPSATAPLPAHSTPVRSTNTLFSDDFSDPSSGWDKIRGNEGITDYESGVYRIWVNVSNTDVWSNPGRSFQDVHIEVDATKAGGPDDNDFGVQCRYQSVDRFYSFIISSDGYYGIVKVVDDDREIIGMNKLAPDNGKAIRQGNATNHIEAECKGDQLTLWVNGVKLYTVHDGDLTAGDVGLQAGTYDAVGTDIYFDNFVVSQP